MACLDFARDIASDVSLIQRPPSQLTVADPKEANAVLRYVRATADAVVRIMPTEIDQLIFVACGDSGFANAPGSKSQGGLVITATDKLGQDPASEGVQKHLGRGSCGT